MIDHLIGHIIIDFAPHLEHKRMDDLLQVPPVFLLARFRDRIVLHAILVALAIRSSVLHSQIGRFVPERGNPFRKEPGTGA